MNFSLKCLDHEKVDICYFYKGQHNKGSSRLICHKCLLEKQYPLYFLEDAQKVFKYGFRNIDLPILFNYQIMKSKLEKNFSDIKETISNIFDRINTIMDEMKMQYESALKIINQRLEDIIQKQVLCDFKKMMIEKTQSPQELHKEFDKLFQRCKIQQAFQYGKDRQHFRKVKDTLYKQVQEESWNLQEALENFQDSSNIHTSRSQLNQIVIDQALLVSKPFEIKLLNIFYEFSSSSQLWQAIQLQKRLLILFYATKFKFYIRCHGLSLAEIQQKENYQYGGQFSYDESTLTLNIFGIQFSIGRNFNNVKFQQKQLNIQKIYVFEESNDSRIGGDAAL